MLHLNCSPEHITLFEVWLREMAPKGEVAIGTSREDLENAVRTNVERLILVGPWTLFSKNDWGQFDSKTSMLISDIRIKIAQGRAVIFGGDGEVELFGNCVITEVPNMKSLGKALE